MNPVRSRARRVARGLFRCVRTTLVVLLLFGAVLGLFLNKVGLPEFIKNRVIAQARAKGLEVQFSRLRLRWYRGIVAENLHIQGASGAPGPQLFIEEAECPLSPAALRGFQLKMNSLRLREARLIWPLTVTNQPRRTFQINHLTGQVFFRTNGLWELLSLEGEFHGTKLNLSGTLAHALTIRQWKIPRRPSEAPASPETVLHQVERFSSQLKMTGHPELRLAFYADPDDFSTLSVRMYFSASGLDSPWGGGTNLVVIGQVIPRAGKNDPRSAKLNLVTDNAHTPWGQAKSANLDLILEPLLTQLAPLSPDVAVNSNAPPRSPRRSEAEEGPRFGPPQVAPTNANLTVNLIGIETRWGRAEHLSLTANSALSPTNPAMTHTEWTAVAQEVQTEWGQATHAQFDADTFHSLTNWTPAALSAALRLEGARSRWGDAEQAQVGVHGSVPLAGQFQLFQTNQAWPELLKSIPFEATAKFSKGQTRNTKVEQLSLSLENRSPQLRLESSGRAAGGDFTLKAQLNTTNRELAFLASGDLDPQAVSPWLSTNRQKWLASYSFVAPPKLELQGRVILPAFTNQAPDWNREVMPTLELAGKFEIGSGTYRGISFTSLQSPFSMTNLVWRLPQLRVAGPDGTVEADYTSNPLTRDFHWRVQSQIDLMVAKPFFKTEAGLRAVDFFHFASPTAIQADIWGNGLNLERLGVVAQVAATNFTFRGEAVQDCQTRLEYTNQVFRFTECQLQRQGGESGSASGVTLDLRGQKIYFTNGLATLNPYVLTRAVGKAAADAIAPYQFDSPPTVRVNGAVDLKRKRYQEDMHFDVAGGRFHWKQFRLERLEGRVDWVGQTLTLTNVAGAFQTGGLRGEAYFDFSVPREADFSLKAALAGANLREVVGPFSAKTNKLEGQLSGELVITRANSGDLRSWQGNGHLELRDGLIWDIPMFGLFSPVLNAFVPGLGNSRANDATATFVLTNGVFYSKDMEIRATMMRMALEGTAGLNRRVDMRVEAELLRDLPAVGFIISKVFWPVTKLFEYKVTGTLLEPKAEPRYVIPKVLLMPFHPFKTLKSIFTEDQKGTDEKKPAP